METPQKKRRLDRESSLPLDNIQMHDSKTMYFQMVHPLVKNITHEGIIISRDLKITIVYEDNGINRTVESNFFFLISTLRISKLLS